MMSLSSLQFGSLSCGVLIMATGYRNRNQKPGKGRESPPPNINHPPILNRNVGRVERFQVRLVAYLVVVFRDAFPTALGQPN